MLRTEQHFKDVPWIKKLVQVRAIPNSQSYSEDSTMATYLETGRPMGVRPCRMYRISRVHAHPKGRLWLCSRILKHDFQKKFIYMNY